MSRYKLGYVAPLKECSEPVNEPRSVKICYAKEQIFNVEDVKKHLLYDPRTGIFTRRTGRCAGKRAGHLESQGYWNIKLGIYGFMAHRLAWIYMTGSWPKYEVDHKDTDRSNNCWNNLRIATQSQNKANGHLYKNNVLGLKGVSSIPSRPGKYRARIRKNGYELSLGVYNSPEEAHEAYVDAAKKLHGEFARAE